MVQIPRKLGVGQMRKPVGLGRAAGRTRHAVRSSCCSTHTHGCMRLDLRAKSGRAGLRSVRRIMDSGRFEIFPNRRQNLVELTIDLEWRVDADEPRDLRDGEPVLE